MKDLEEYLSKYAFFSDFELEKVKQCFKPKVVKRGEHLLLNGRVCNKLWFLSKGLMRYYLLVEGKEFTKYFTTSPYMFTSQQSFSSGLVSNDNIQALEVSEVYEITKDDAYELLNLSSWAEFVRSLVLEVNTYTEVILLSQQTKDAEQRYLELLNDDADLLNRVPQKYIAQYLGIAPQSLSRLRSHIQLRDKLT